MVDPSPLLSESNSNSIDSQKQILSLDQTIESCLGNFGWVQLLQAVLVSFSWVFDAQQTFISVFTDSSPSWHCTTQLGDDSCNQCRIPRSGWTWDAPIQTSIISEWDLACAGPFITGLPTSSFFMGCLAGGFVLATLADSSLGRKNMLVLACLIMSLAGVLTVFSPNIWVYAFLRFITGFGRATIGTCALVLSSELVGKRWRGEVGVIGFFCFTFGFLSLPGIAYMTRASPSWRMVYLWTSVPVIGYCILVHFIGHESPRWLLIQGRKEEAIKTLHSLSTSSTKSTTSIDVPSCKEPGGAEQQEETWSSRMKMLVVKRWAFKRLMTVMTAGFGIGMVYYGMPLGVSNLDFHNLYLSVTLNALSELPASLIAFCFIGRLNRRTAVMAFSMVSGVFSILCVVVGYIKRIQGLQMGLELVSFFSACTAFNVLLIYTLELFPTCVRNSALSMVRQAIVLGGVLSPVLVAAGREDGKLFLSYGVFGVVIGCCGLFVAWLPETRGGNLCDTMDEQEEYKDINASKNANCSV